ncbi:LuxR C-terminal-related transcriptional regulator [Amycolatopsis thermophila]|uniref:DNA-binding NarL/FixJ family response regulator n=1 Tax=Amycolatopsis thermophila TaxID=206084 RepID=A0ABU0F387_9PSEU|nr:response regulator transcription factor [Amycolatopsis thermophila]MDQ0381550.1 DNA-binding NarL/FixJ family response regulator [Amycolatopsis thermophila]
MTFVHVFLIDDHEVLTDGLAMRLNAVSDVWVVGKAVPGSDNLTAEVARQRPDVITIELDRVGMRSTALLTALIAASPKSHIVVLTGSTDKALAADAARAGADAWVRKDSSFSEFVDVLRRVTNGEACYPPEELGHVLRQLRAEVRQARERSGPLDALTDREREVLESMVEGKRPGQIAADLSVSANTVRTHIGRILAKLGVHSSIEAISTARSTGVLPRPDDSARPPGASE